MSTKDATLSSSEKKRIRDRRAQKVMRDKRESRINALENRVAFCERHHPPEGYEHLMATIDRLRQENELLRSRQNQLQQVFLSWGTDYKPPTPSASSTPATDPTISQESLFTYQPGSELGAAYTIPFPGGAPFLSKNPAVAASRLPNSQARDVEQSEITIGATPPTTTPQSIHLPTLPHLTSLQPVPNSVPTWCLTPMNEYGHNASLIPATVPWLAHPEQIAACPLAPSPLDLLHGTRRNFLADQIHRSLRRHRLRDPEYLASGWMLYTYSKWRVSPGPATFERLPTCLRPVMAQIQKGHPSALDFVKWPQMRINMIENWTKYDLVELIGYLSCCVKLRWAWGEDILERDSEDNLLMRRESFEVFTRVSGWGLTSEFIDKYPELLEGMDIEAMRFRMDLI